MYDYHIHTNMSEDSNMTAIQVAKRAKELGLKEICITNHQDWTCVESGEYKYASTDEDWGLLINELKEAKEIFPKIKLGCELGFFPENVQAAKDFVSRHHFDYIIGSVHRLNGLWTADPRMVFPDVEVKEWYNQYFKRLRGMIQSRFCDCIGHFDIVKKTAPSLQLEHYISEVKDCISDMLKNDIGFELNTQGWNQKCKECYPSVQILKMLHAAGVRKVTIGSDSHTVDKVGFKIKEGLSLLKEIGFKEICTFTRRKPVFHSI